MFERFREPFTTSKYRQVRDAGRARLSAEHGTAGQGRGEARPGSSRNMLYKSLRINMIHSDRRPPRGGVD